MTDKAYIVANKQQEREVLEKLEREGILWRGGDKPTEKSRLIKDPITLFARDNNQLTYDYEVSESYLANFEIVYDGRKEGKMGKKMPTYVVFNMSMGNNHHTPVATGDDLDELLVQYHGKAYQVMAVKPVFEREEW